MYRTVKIVDNGEVIGYGTLSDEKKLNSVWLDDTLEEALQRTIDLNKTLLVKFHWPDHGDPEVRELLDNPQWRPAPERIHPDTGEAVPSLTDYLDRIDKACEIVAQRRADEAQD